MQNFIDTPVSRRGLLGSAIFGVALAASGTSLAAPMLPAAKLRPEVRARALAAMSKHIGRIQCRDLIGICDFDDPSSAPRFHLLDG